MKLKGNPTTVRLEVEKLDFLRQKFNLKSVQQVVDFLIDRVYWQEFENKSFAQIAKKVIQTTTTATPHNESAALADYEKRIWGIENEHEAQEIGTEITLNSRLSKTEKQTLLNSITKNWSL